MEIEIHISSASKGDLEAFVGILLNRHVFVKKRHVFEFGEENYPGVMI